MAIDSDSRSAERFYRRPAYYFSGVVTALIMPEYAASIPDNDGHLCTILYIGDCRQIFSRPYLSAHGIITVTHATMAWLSHSR